MVSIRPMAATEGFETMKTKIAMLISVAGVLAAGSAAALVNTQVLGGNTISQTPKAVDSTSPTLATLPITAPVVTTPVTTAAPASTAPATPAVSTQAVYAIGDAGNVTLDTAGDVLTIVAVTPAPGWTVSKAETDGATNAEIKFQAGTIEVEFRANLLFGVVTTSVETNDTSVTSSSVEDSTSGRHGGNGGGSDDRGGGEDD